MSDTQAEGQGITPERLENLERTSSRVLFVVGLLALAAGSILSEDQRLRPELVLAWIGLFVLVKLVLAVLGARAGWKVWPALVAEIGAFAVVGYIVQFGIRLDPGNLSSLALVLLSAVMLGAAALLRRRAARS